MKVIRDIWVCQDCLMAAVNGDFTGLDYAYEPDEAERRMEEIVAGLEALPGLVSDSFDSSDPESVEFECQECGHIHSQRKFKEVVTHPDPNDLSYTETFFECPECHSYDTTHRDDGRNEFSSHACDCCGNALAGYRERMAQLIHEETT